MLRDFIVGFILPLFLLFVGLALISDGFGSYQCRNFEKNTGITANWSSFDSCYVEVEDRIMQWDEYKAWITANGLKHD